MPAGRRLGVAAMTGAVKAPRAMPAASGVKVRTAPATRACKAPLSSRAMRSMRCSPWAFAGDRGDQDPPGAMKRVRRSRRRLDQRMNDHPVKGLRGVERQAVGEVDADFWQAECGESRGGFDRQTF